MDGNRFDTITRTLARPRSRRGFLGGVAALAAGVLAGRAGGGTEAASQCRAAGHACEGNQTCCDGLVCIPNGSGTAARCTPCPSGQIACGGVCIPACTALDQCHVAGVCDPAARACTNPSAADGTICNDGDACTLTDTCQAGVCVGSDPVICQPLDQCHLAGTCDPLSGACSNPNAADDSPCNDDNACTTGDTCQGGMCLGGAALVCTTGNPCLTAGCDTAIGCTTTPRAAGASCDADQDACTVGDACDGRGTCLPGQQRTCDACLRCNPTNGTCEPDPDQVGGACPGGGDPCFGGFQCNAAGACVGVDPVVCTASDQCHVAGTCDRTTGVCSNPDAPDDTRCDDGDRCTTGDVCMAGVCAGTPRPRVGDACTEVFGCCTGSFCNAEGVCRAGGCSYFTTGGRACTASDASGCCLGSMCVEGDCCVASGQPCRGSTASCCSRSCTAGVCD